jgi:hypothetical protein
MGQGSGARGQGPGSGVRDVNALYRAIPQQGQGIAHLTDADVALKRLTGLRLGRRLWPIPCMILIDVFSTIQLCPYIVDALSHMLVINTICGMPQWCAARSHFLVKVTS